MIYAYIRVSTDRQTTENQRFEIENFAKNRNLVIDKWIDETVSSMKKMKERLLGAILKKLKEGDTLIVSEISRIGRNLMQIAALMGNCLERNVAVLAVKEGFELGDNINSKVLLFAFGLCAEIERDLFSQRIKEALARRKASGMKLGRPLGSRKKNLLLEQHHDRIVKMLAAGKRQCDISRALKAHRHTVRDYINKRIYVEDFE